jgi:peptide subunit release factor 1 (eRF1)
VLTTGPDDGDLGQDPVEVRGSTAPLHKVRGGGWAHRRMQHKVEETWRQNVREVAERIDEELARTAARVLVIAGEEQSRAQLRRELGERAAAGAVDLELTGGRAGPDLDELEKAVAGAVRDVVAADRRAVLERYHQAAGRADGLAVDGLEAVLAALRAEAVDTVLLDGSVQRAAEVWISEVPSQIGTSAAALRELGTEPVARVAADAALLRAAAGTGAALVVVGGGDTGLVAHPIADGVAALLRYPLPSGG